MKVPRGELHALPITLPLDDVNALWDRRIDLDQYGRMIGDTSETLYREGAQTGRLLVLHLHPWLIGQPFRIGSRAADGSSACHALTESPRPGPHPSGVDADDLVPVDRVLVGVGDPQEEGQSSWASRRP